VFMVMFSWALLVFTIIVLLGSIGICHVVMFSGVINVCGCAFLSFVDILVIIFLGFIGVRSCCSLGVSWCS
jgi:hypothetical protein